MQSLRYIPSLNPYTGSINATLLMGQLEYWFQKKGGQSFYKFIEPCEDINYQIGDSWCEELGFSKAEFRSAFAKIGKVYKSKKAYLESTDKFEGKLYLSYYDRIKHLTYYVRNEAKVQAIYTELHISTVGESLTHASTQIDPPAPSAHEACSLTQVLESPMQSDSYTLSGQAQSTLPISVDYSQRLHSEDKELLTHTHVLEIYHTTCPSLTPIQQLTPTLRDQLTQFIHELRGDSYAIRQVFEKVAASDFLSGRILGKGWKATLHWITKGQRYRDILADKYRNRIQSFKAKYQAKTSRFNQIASHNWDFDQLEALEQQYIEEKIKNLEPSTNPLLSRLRSLSEDNL